MRTGDAGDERGAGRENGQAPFGEDGTELVRRLRQLEHRVPPEELDELWIFPPLEDPEGTREFLLFTRAAGPRTRRVYSARSRGRGEDGGKERAPVHGAAGENGDPRSADAAADPSSVPGPVNGERRNGDGADSGFQSVVEHGRVPAERLPRIVERFLRRLGEERTPVHVQLDGSVDRWGELLSRLGQGEDGREN